MQMFLVLHLSPSYNVTYSLPVADWSMMWPSYFSWFLGELLVIRLCNEVRNRNFSILSGKFLIYRMNKRHSGESESLFIAYGNGLNREGLII